MFGKLFKRPPKTPWKVPVLCYHSWMVATDQYQGNDHLALESDLDMLARRGYSILPLTRLVEVMRGERPHSELDGRKLVGISFDDGIDLDWHARPDAAGNPQKSFAQILREAKIKAFCKGPLAVSFVIASNEARTQLDSLAWRGQNEWNDDWWQLAATENIIGIANHSWDHLHDQLDNVRQRDNLKGSFLHIDTYEDAEQQIAEAELEISRLCGGKNLPLFGYPYGHVAPYLKDSYFPQEGQRLGIKGAFSTCGHIATAADSYWSIPRLVCGWHWKTSEDFSRLLDSIETGSS